MSRWLPLVAASLAARAALAQSEPAPPLLTAEPPPVAETAAPAPAAKPPRSTRFGLLLGVVGLPQPLSATVFARFGDLIGLGTGVGALPGPLGSVVLGAAGISGGSLDAMAFDGELRIFPFRGAFYLGGGLGRMSL